MKKFGILLFPVVAVILEIIPLGAVCVFASSPTDSARKTFSYFSLVPFGYANFAPFITAVLTIAVLLFAIVSLKKAKAYKTVFILSLIATVISILPLLYGFEYYSTVGFFITVMLPAECVFAKILTKKTKNMKNKA